MTKKIALVGSAPSSVCLAPYGSPEWEIWACSPGVYGVAPKVDRWFELHRYEPGQTWFSPEYCNFLRDFKGPVYVAEKRSEIPHSALLPVQDLVTKYGPYFFTSSLAWMFALAIEEGATTIGLWGVDMAANEEYGLQRSGCQYFAMLAKARGIEVGVPPESDLFRPPILYGVSEIDHGRIKMLARRRELEIRLQQVQAEVTAKSQESFFLKGAIDDLNYMEQNWFGAGIECKYVEPAAAKALEIPLMVRGEKWETPAEDKIHVVHPRITDEQRGTG